MLIINAGSEIKGGTKEQAIENAKRWLRNIHAEGFLEVEMSEPTEYEKGQFEFKFTHNVTKKVAILHTHGYTPDEELEFTFIPRMYWNGCSTSDPKIQDWLPDGWKYRIEFYQ